MIARLLTTFAELAVLFVFLMVLFGLLKLVLSASGYGSAW